RERESLFRSRDRLDEPIDVTEHRREARREAHRVRAVDDPMVVRQRQRQYQARHETAVLEHRTPLTTGDAEDRDLGRVDDRREERSADRAEARYREHAALHLVRTELAVARARRQLAELLRNLVDVLAVDVANDGNDEPVLRIDREAE